MGEFPFFLFPALSWLVMWMPFLRHMHIFSKFTATVILCSIACSIVASWLITKSKLWDLQGTPLLDHLTLILFLGIPFLLLAGLSLLATASKKDQVAATETLRLTPVEMLASRERMCQHLEEWHRAFLATSLTLDLQSPPADWLELNLVESPNVLQTALPHFA